jgi:hypothetical protein
LNAAITRNGLAPDLDHHCLAFGLFSVVSSNDKYRHRRGGKRGVL